VTADSLISGRVFLSTLNPLQSVGDSNVEARGDHDSKRNSQEREKHANQSISGALGRGEDCADDGDPAETCGAHEEKHYRYVMGFGCESDGSLHIQFGKNV
jgi:hypothetical protein